MAENLQANTDGVADGASDPSTTATKKRGMIKCMVMRDYWDESGERILAGSVVELPAEEAMDGVEIGALSRVKDAKK